MTDPPEPDESPLDPGEQLLEGYVPPDPDERPPLELGRATGDVLPFGTLIVLLVWALFTLAFAWRALTGDVHALVAWGANVGGAPDAETAWRLVASTFLHAGFAHVAMNAVSLLMFGAAVESMFAPGAFAVIYVFGGAGASLGSLLWHTARHGGVAAVSVGGSGAVFAMGGAVLAAALHLRGRLPVGRARALAAGALFLLMNSLTAGFARLGTDNAAHASGLVVGFLLGLVLPVSPKLEGPARSPLLIAAALLAVGLAVAALSYSVVHGLHAYW